MVLSSDDVLTVSRKVLLPKHKEKHFFQQIHYSNDVLPEEVRNVIDLIVYSYCRSEIVI